jgi:uncharacterized membrane protein
LNFTNTVRVERPAHDVFAYLAEFENVPRWNYAIARTWKTSTGPVGVGSRYRQERTVPRRAEESFEVVEFAPDSRLAIAGTLGSFPARLTYMLQPDGDATTVVNDVELEVRGALRVVAPLAASKVRSSVAANLGVLKQLLES